MIRITIFNHYVLNKIHAMMLFIRFVLKVMQTRMMVGVASPTHSPSITSTVVFRKVTNDSVKINVV